MDFGGVRSKSAILEAFLSVMSSLVLSSLKPTHSEGRGWIVLPLSELVALSRYCHTHKPDTRRPLSVFFFLSCFNFQTWLFNFA